MKVCKFYKPEFHIGIAPLGTEENRQIHKISQNIEVI